MPSNLCKIIYNDIVSFIYWINSNNDYNKKNYYNSDIESNDSNDSDDELYSLISYNNKEYIEKK